MGHSIIYLRTSTEEQNPQNQLEACEKLAKKLKLLEYEIVEDKVSGWKDIKREKMDKIKNLISKGEVENQICWDLDRLYRNRLKLIGFFELCKIHNCKIYSVRQDWLESINRIQPPFNDIMHGLMLQVMGWLAEEESSKKSERIKLSIQKGKNGTYSKYGNKWGRKAIITNRLKEKIKELRSQGLSFRQILNHPEVYYYDKNNSKVRPSIFFIHGIVKENL